MSKENLLQKKFTSIYVSVFSVQQHFFINGLFLNFVFRVFSNFDNLEELHLTDAFANNSPEDLASDLHDIFVNSDLTQLRKLHLEQNEISQFQDPRVFCDLPSLEELYLGEVYIVLFLEVQGSSNKVLVMIIIPISKCMYFLKRHITFQSKS